jgi:DNA-binding PadR family transcriptional regulator
MERNLISRGEKYHNRKKRGAGFIWLFIIWRLSKEPMYGYSMID